MHGKVKLTRRQIKEDKFTSFMLHSKDSAVANWQYWLIGAAALVLVIVGVYYFANRGSGDSSAAALLSQALNEYQSGQRQVALLTLNQVVDRHGSDPAARQATMLLGMYNYENRSYPEATRFYELYLSKYKGDNLNRAAAQAGLAGIAENQGKYGEAASKFMDAVKEYPEGPQEADYYYGALRNYLEAGDIPNAKVSLDSLQSRHPAHPAYAKAARIFAEKTTLRANS